MTSAGYGVSQDHSRGQYAILVTVIFSQVLSNLVKKPEVK